MDENVFNMAIRQFLKEVGVSSQREIELAVRAALASKKLRGAEKLKATAVITLEGTGLRHEVKGTIALA